MELHHKIKPYHHVTIWAVSAILLGVMALISANASDSLANENQGPSEKTKRFFGAEDGGAKQFTQPVECTQQQNEQQAQYDTWNAEMTQLNAEMQQLSTQMQQATTPEEQASIQQQLQTKQTRMQEIQTAMQAAQEQQSQNQGPSAACKQAIVNMMKAEMSTMKGLINSRIMGTFGKVNAAIAKIEAKIPALKDAGVDPVLIARIEADIAKIKTNEATLKSFFNNMIGLVDQFLAVASTDPDKAFLLMQNGFGNGTESDKAANAADGLVAAFEDLELAVSELK